MGSRLYVGNLSYSTTEESLRAAFAPYGQVTSANIMIDRLSGRSRGFGFVEFGSDEEAKKAIESLNGADLDGRSLTVNEARAREEGGNRSGGGGFRPHRGPPTDRGWDNAPPRDFGGGGYGDSGGASGGGGRGGSRGGRRNDRDRRRNNDNDW
jgi:RNA recognition motif-containing protein